MGDKVKIVFVSNYYNHHQSSLCNYLYKELFGEFCFICTSHIPEERIALGYQVLSAPFVLNYDENKERCNNEIISADAVVIGSAPYGLVKTRLKNNKLVFFYSERINKAGDIKPFKQLLRLIRYSLRYNRFKNVYLLCASAFTSYDYSTTHSFVDKAFKWGYFPETREYDVERLIDSKNRQKILWVGRLIEWKHPETVIHVAKMLKEEGYKFSIDMVGSGTMAQSLRQMISDFNLTEYVNFVGSVPTNMVYKYMEQAGVYLFTSDRNEGWGAVLNESMNSACAVVASDSIGSVPFLVNNNENGLIYHYGDVNQLFYHVKRLLDNHALQRKLGKNAYYTIEEKWNANIAAKRLVSLTSCLVDKTPSQIPFKEGICSKSPIIKDDWFTLSGESS